MENFRAPIVARNDLEKEAEVSDRYFLFSNCRCVGLLGMSSSFNKYSIQLKT